MTRTSQKFFSLLLTCSLVVSGCSFAEEDAGEEKNTQIEEKKFLPEVEIFSVNSQPKEGKTLLISGTLVAAEEITIASEASGTVSQVIKDEGAIVKEGEKIMKLEANSNLLNASYAAAKAAFNNSLSVLTLTRQSANRDIAQSQSSVDEATIALNRVKKTSQFITDSASSQYLSAQKTVEISEKNLEIAQAAFDQIQENEKKIQQNLLETTSDSLSRVLVNFRSTLHQVDELIGASELNRTSNDDYEVYLIGTSRGIMLPTQDLWKSTSKDLFALDAQFRDFEKKTYLPEDEVVMLEFIDQIKENEKEIRTILRNVEEMLRKSIPSRTFLQSRIDSLKTQNTAHQNSLEADIATFTAMQQSLTDFHLQSPQRITNSGLNLSVAQSQVASSEEALSNTKSSKGLSGVNQEADLQAAEQRLKAAKSSLESTKSRSALSIQSADSQYDSADAALAQAEISLSKLTVISGITGTVSEILRHDGDTVSPGTPLVIVADFSQLQLQGDVSLEESFLLKKGMKAEITIDGVEKKYEGKISLVAPQADKITRRVAIEIEMINTENIPANVFATAKIFIKGFQTGEDEIFIPYNSVVIEGSEIFTFIAVQKNPEVTTASETKIYVLEKRLVEISDVKPTSQDMLILVKSGLHKLDRVILNPSKDLQSGQEVKDIFYATPTPESTKKEMPSLEGMASLQKKNSSSLEIDRDDIISTQEVGKEE